MLMRELLDDLDAIGAITAEGLHADRVRRRAVERILTQLVDLAADINQHLGSTVAGTVTTEYRESFDAAARTGAISAELAASLKPRVGMRNVLIHEYVNVDLGLVAEAVPLASEEYAAYVRSIAQWLAQR